MKLILAFFILLCSLHSQAQLTYEELDAYSVFISAKQNEANMRSYTNDGKDYTVSFVEKNFIIHYYNGLASQAVYIQEGAGSDVLKLYEGIDFAKATSIVRKDTYHKNAGAIRVSFPEGSILVTEYENGKKIAASKTNTIDFFFAVTPGSFTLWSSDGIELFNKLAELIYAKKTAAGTVQETVAKEITSEWNKTLSQFSSASFQEFYNNYQTGIFAQQAMILKRAIDARDQRNIILNARIDSIALTYKFKYGISSSEFKTLNKEAAEMMTWKNGKDSGLKYYQRKYNGVGKPWPEGTEMVFMNGNNIGTYQYVIKRDKQNPKPIDELFAQMREAYTKIFDAAMVSFDKGVFSITSPDKTRIIQLQVMSIFGSSSLLITFAEGSLVKG